MQCIRFSDMNTGTNVKTLSKKTTNIFGNFLGAALSGNIIRLKNTRYSSGILDRFRRKINPALIALGYKTGVYKNTRLKLHLGCGNKHFDGYVNIDHRNTSATDLVCDIRKLPYPAGSVDLIETYHVIEHLNRHDLPIALKEWHRVLAVGGKLIIECPDFDEAVKSYIEGNEKRIDNIFGLQRFPGDVHQFGYNFKRLKKALEEAGFKDIEEKKPLDYHTKDEPCLRAICVKGDNW